VFSIKTIDAQDSLKVLKIIPFPNLGYSPETRWYIGGVALFNIDRFHDSITRVSNIKPEINFTQNKQVILSLNFNLYSKSNNWVVYGENSFSKFPENYWGIGNNTSEENIQSYEANRIEFENEFLHKILPSFYGGIKFRYENIYNVTGTGEFLSDLGVQGSQGGISSGFGYNLQFDTRDNILNAKSGSLLNFSNVFFSSATGSEFNFINYEGDIRKFISITGADIIGMQLKGVFNSGLPPFRMLALLGSDSDMRGYYNGRFRDNNYLSMQAEYRRFIWKFVGVAVFAGAGRVAPDLDFAIAGFKHSIGGGLRLRVDKQNDINLRFDYAVGKNSSGFYVAFGEAF